MDRTTDDDPIPNPPVEKEEGKTYASSRSLLRGDRHLAPAYRWNAAAEPAGDRTEESQRVQGASVRRRWRPVIAIAVPVIMVAALAAVFRDSPGPVAPAREDPLISYCATVIERSSIELPDPSQAGSDEAANSVPVTAGRLVLLTERMLGVAPEEARPALRNQVESYRDLVRTGDAAGFYSPQLQASRNQVHAVSVASCDFKEFGLTATSFAYEEVPGRLGSGRYSILMRNTSRDGHEMVLFRRKPEFAGEFSAILRREAQGEEAVRLAGGYADPGTQTTVTAELLGGDYAIACFQRTAGEPHWQRGMIAEFTVR